MSYSDFTSEKTAKRLATIGRSKAAFSAAVRDVVAHGIGEAVFEDRFTVINGLISAPALKSPKSGILKDGRRVIAYVQFLLPAAVYDRTSGKFIWRPASKPETRNKVATGRFLLDKARSKSTGKKIYSRETVAIDSAKYRGIKLDLTAFEALKKAPEGDRQPRAQLDARAVSKYIDGRLKAIEKAGDKLQVAGAFTDAETLVKKLDQLKEALIRNAGKFDGWNDRAIAAPAGAVAGPSQPDSDFAGNVPAGSADFAEVG